MKTITLSLLIAVSLISASFVVMAQDPDEDVTRGSFLTSRPGSANKPAGSQSGPKRTSNNASGNKPKSTTHPTNNSGNTTGVDSSSNPKLVGSGGDGSSTDAADSGPIGLGYSLYMKDPRGNIVRADPKREFHAGDHIRIALEPNTDGYLYVFYTENSGTPQMLFPDARLNGGENRIQAHVPYEVPSSFETEESRRWFVFDKNPAIEQLYIVVTRTPLNGVPSGDDLAAACRKSGRGIETCSWQPPADVWAKIKA